MKTLTISRNFFCYANPIDLEHCTGLPDFVTGAYTIAVICEGERTHLCSLSPSSYADELRNELVCKESDSERLREWLDSNDGADWESEACEGTYYNFIKHDPASERMTELIEFSDDFEVPDEFDPETDRLPDDVHDELWEQAHEYFQGNWHSPACCDYQAG
jgi:hypothetical protein